MALSQTEVRKEAAKLLEAAVQLMNNEGAHWIQGHYRHIDDKGETSYCAIGAINHLSGKVPGDSWERSEVRYAAIAALGHGLQNGLSNDAEERVIRWNDNERRKWPDIVKRFNRAAARLRTAAK